MFYELMNPMNLWEQHWNFRVEDFRYMLTRESHDVNLQINENGKTLADYPSMPLPSTGSFHHLTNRLIRDTLHYDVEIKEISFNFLYNGLNNDQLRIYNTI